MKSSNYSAWNAEFICMTKKSHILFIWTDRAPRNSTHNFTRVSHVVFNNSYFTFALPRVEYHTYLCRNLMNYFSKKSSTQITEQSIKSKIESLTEYYVPQDDDYFYSHIY